MDIETVEKEKATLAAMTTPNLMTLSAGLDRDFKELQATPGERERADAIWKWGRLSRMQAAHLLLAERQIESKPKDKTKGDRRGA